MILDWIIWSLFTYAYATINAVASRAKNSRSIFYNATSTMISASFYMASILFVGNMILKARSLQAVEIAVVLYGVLSMFGAITGQLWAIRFESNRQIR